jgi:class 3 adenylate cyclase/tetratricopeptide (TPR) repeat protein
MGTPGTVSDPYVFLSYSSADRQRALEIADALAEHGVRTWIDRTSITGGTRWSEEIVRGIESCAAVLLLCSAASNASRNVQQEIQLAWEVDRPIIPLLLEPVQVTESVRYAVVGRQWLELFDRPDERWIPEVLQALSMHGIRPRADAATVGESKPDGDRRCPACDAVVTTKQRFCPNCGAALSLGPTNAVGAERRNLTVLVVDFVPTDDEHAALDAEDFASTERDARQMALEILTRHEGTPVHGAAHGLIGCFGYPVVHEDDARRSVMAALEICESIDHVKGSRVRACVAIHTGTVIASASDSGTGSPVTGDVPSTAAAMLSIGEPGKVVVSAATHQLVEGWFRTSDLGRQRVRGRAQPMQMYQIIEESEARTRFEAAALRGLTPLLGRQAEMSLLLDRWGRACDGEGQVVVLIGEAGIGKSRLSYGLRDEVGNDQTAWIVPLQCSELHQQSPLYPVVDLLTRLLFSGSSQDTVDDRQKVIHDYLGEAGLGGEMSDYLLATLLGVPTDAAEPAALMTPDRLRQETLTLLLSLVLARAEQQPVLVINEDLHWADPSTLELLGMLVEYCPSVPVMVLATSRPGLMASWLSRTHVTTINLSRLSAANANDLIDRLLQGRALPPDVVNEIIGKADGNPLYLEELTRAVLEMDRLPGKGGQNALTGDALHIGIPATLQDLLAARLSRLGDAHEIAQLGATVGREFSFDLIHAISSSSETWLHHALARLIDADIIQQRGLPSRTTYLFRHALIQQAAYDSLVRDRRQEIHRRIATALIERFPDTANSQPELVAHHFTEGDDAMHAAPYWLLAGQHAQRSFSNVEAITHLQRGLAVLASTPESPERQQVELGLQMTLGLTLMATRGFAAPEVEAAFQRAYDLCQSFGDVPDIVPALHGLWTYYLVRAELDTALDIAERLVRLADQTHDDSTTVQADLVYGTTRHFMGDLEDSRATLEHLLTLYDRVHHAANAFLYGHEPGSAGMHYLSLDLCLLGYPDQAIERSRLGIELGRQVNHPLSLARNLLEGVVLSQLLRQSDTGREQAQTGLAFSSEHGLVLFIALGTAVLGAAISAGGKPATGIELLRTGIAGFRATGAGVGVPVILNYLAEALDLHGDCTEALSIVDEAIELANSTGGRYHLAESQRIRAGLLIASGQVAEGERQLLAALDTARSQHARWFELRVATDLARLWQSQSRSDDARTLLAPVVASFTEGFSTVDFRAARDLLDVL